jgi:hypothetical protein
MPIDRRGGVAHLDRQKRDRVLGPRRLGRPPKQPAPSVELLGVEIVSTRHRRETDALPLSLRQDPQLDTRINLSCFEGL